MSTQTRTPLSLLDRGQRDSNIRCLHNPLTPFNMTFYPHIKTYKCLNEARPIGY
jgi:D-serine deaminase-like pyridoxal phosphate-dependent protein